VGLSGEAAERITESKSMAIINGDDARNLLIGTDENDVINGFGSPDELNGQGGDDELNDPDAFVRRRPRPPRSEGATNALHQPGLADRVTAVHSMCSLVTKLSGCEPKVRIHAEAQAAGIHHTIAPTSRRQLFLERSHSALRCPDPPGQPVPVAGGQGPETVPNAQGRSRQRRTRPVVKMHSSMAATRES
jgi:Ca2+-binding RTX toxin-like protein